MTNIQTCVLIERMNESDTKQKILDAAEALFAREGYHRTSLRAITGRAGVNLAAVNYHFGSKESLLEAVFARRLIPLNEVRMEKMQEVVRAALDRGARPRVADIMRAFIEPTLRFKETSPGARDFIMLVARSFAEADDTVRTIFHRLILPMLQVMIDSLKEALPDASEADLFWKLRFAMGSFVHTMLDVCDCDPIPESIRSHFEKDGGTEKMTEMLVRFVTAGIEAS